MVGLDPEFEQLLRLVVAGARQQGIKVTVTSTSRTFQEQAYLYKLYLQGKGPKALPPGTSPHEFGCAADVTSRRLKPAPMQQKVADPEGLAEVAAIAASAGLRAFPEEFNGKRHLHLWSPSCVERRGARNLPPRKLPGPADNRGGPCKC